MRYYIRRDANAEIRGPLTVEELVAAIDAKTISDNWLASSDIGQSTSQLDGYRARDWFQLSTIPHLQPEKDPPLRVRPSVKPCRNCGSDELFYREVGANGGYGPELLPLGFFSGARFRLRVCGGCGLVEWFVPPEHLEKVREKFFREP